MCIGEWEEMGRVFRKSVSREVFLNLGVTQNRMGSGRASKEQLMAGEAQLVASLLSISQFQVSKFPCWHHLVIVPIIGRGKPLSFSSYTSPGGLRETENHKTLST